MLLSATVLAAVAGFLYGKRKGKKIAESSFSSEKFLASQTSKLEIRTENPKLTQNSKVIRGNKSEARRPKPVYESPVEEDKPYIQKYDMVTVLFADIEGFTEITDNLDPETLLDELNSFFFYFDTIIDRYQIEKIKTMGDAYMCAGGIPQKNRTNPVDVVMVALDVQNHLNRLSQQNPDVWSVRIGIHTGQVVAGMLGHKKLSFDIWGHTVNVASRLESSCKAGEINVSGTTFEKIKPYFDCEYQGKLFEPNEISYHVKGLKPEFLEKDIHEQFVPNHAFFVQMQLLRLDDLSDFVEGMMTDTALNLYFHNFKHVLDVYEQVELLAYSENVKDEDLLLLKTAALLHDIGYSISYDDVQILSEDMAWETLPLFHYKPRQIEQVCQLMKASHHETKPNNILEEILHDANMMYFGRVDFTTRMMHLFRELKEHGIHIDRTKWLHNQIHRLNNHRFYTRAARNFVKVSTDQQIANTKGLLIDTVS